MPNFALFLNADPVVIVHALAAFAALFLGAIILLVKKGTRYHKHMGKFWVLLMVFVAGSSFWISGIRMIGPFSPIHLISLYTFWALFFAVRDARAGRISAHKKGMRNMFFIALVGAGFFTFIPGRLMFEVFFGGF